MLGLSGFCLATVVFLVVRDLFVPEIAGVEVWFGIEVRGAAARLSAPLHWAIFAVGAWGFATRRVGTFLVAAVYAFYVAGSHLVWNGISPNGGGWTAGVVQGVFLALPGLGLLYGHRVFRRESLAV